MPAAVKDPYELRKLYKYLRVTDVADAMDGIGYFNIGFMSTDLSPISPGTWFWGPAVTMRCVPSNRPMWKLNTTEEMVDVHRIWFKEVGVASVDKFVKPGCVIITDAGDSGEVGWWGSNNALAMVAAGAVGIITDGYCRDTREVALQKTPVVCRKRGRPIIPGRIMCIETQTTVSCAGAQVRPGDMIGWDDDGGIAVPAEVAEEVAHHAIAVMLADMKGRRRLYERLKMTMDDTVDVAMAEAYYKELGAL